MGQTYSQLLTHIVFSTKERRRMLSGDVQARVHKYITGIVNNRFGYLICIGGMEDHLHLLMDIKPSSSVSDAMRVVKASSSGWIHETFPQLRDFAWQGGYAAFSVSASRKRDTIEYIKDQAKHHKTKTFTEELIEFLEKYGIEYDKRYIHS